MTSREEEYVIPAITPQKRFPDSLLPPGTDPGAIPNSNFSWLGVVT